MRLFPFAAPPAARLADHAGLFPPQDRKRAERELSRFSERFPQFDFRIVTVDLDPAADLRLFAFWLLNAMPLAEGETAERREWSLLLVIRPDLSMALVPGYAAEVWTGDAAWPVFLDDLCEQVRLESLSAGLKPFLGQLTDHLISSWQRMEDRRAAGRLRRTRRS